MTKRTNEEWLAALRGSAQEEALNDLRSTLLYGLRSALSSRSDLGESDLEDFVQDALLKILDGLDSFRGESQFTTWAQKIAVRVAYTELRRRRWRDRSLDELTSGVDGEEGGDFTPKVLTDSTIGPEQQAILRTLSETLNRIILEKLTARQRQAMTAVRIQGMPLEEVARRMNTNRNSLYKLLHDARQKLQKELMAEGLSPEDILSVFNI